ncbi:Ankyrin repeat and KH domain-containing protein mask [Spatholobus suberectus]|nr:Ankyrin repeat and KH domain-containing protein mask [Spatholobus suberectus]
MAAASGHWSEASSYSEIHPDWFRIPLTARGITALQVAVSMEQTSFVEKLVDFMNMQDMEICMADGNTAFSMAAISGNVRIAEILFGKNPKLLWIRGQKDMLPIQLASSAGHIPMTEFLFKAREDLHNNLPFQDIVKLYFLTITNNIYTVALKLLDCYPKLVTAENEEGLTPLQMLAQFSLCKETIGHRDIVSSLFKGMEQEEESLNCIKLSKAMFDAAKSGNIQILEFLFKYHPDLLFEVDSREQRSFLHIAILYRQESVYRLILSKGASKNVMIRLVDFEGNNVLHLAGKLAPEERFGLSSTTVLMCSEEIWFQEVEKIVPPAMKTKRNKDGWTPKELYYWSHKELHKESISAVKAMANTLVVVATLIITLGITGAITIPIKDIDSRHTPIFRKKTWYTFFFLSVAFGTCFCAASMFCYASVILPSSLKPKDESVRLRQTKMEIGIVSLVVSAAVMFTAAVSGSILVFDFVSNWGLYFITELGCITLVLHLTLDYFLWRHIAHSVVSFCEVALVKLAKTVRTYPQDL